MIVNFFFIELLGGNILRTFLDEAFLELDQEILDLSWTGVAENLDCNPALERLGFVELGDLEK